MAVVVRMMAKKRRTTNHANMLEPRSCRAVHSSVVSAVIDRSIDWSWQRSCRSQAPWTIAWIAKKLFVEDRRSCSSIDSTLNHFLVGWSWPNQTNSVNQSNKQSINQSIVHVGFAAIKESSMNQCAKAQWLKVVMECGISLNDLRWLDKPSTSSESCVDN